MEFKDKIKSLRKEHNLTQDSLSAILHVSRSLVAKWENGLGLPSEDTIKDICNYFNITEDELFDKSDSVNVIVNKNKKLKKKNITIIILTIILASFISYALIYLIIEQCNKFKIMKESERIEELINTEEVTYNNMRMDIDHAYYDSYRKIYYAKNYSGLELDVNINDTLYKQINMMESKIKLSIYDDYIQLYNNQFYKHNYEFEVVLEGLSYDTALDVYVEEIVLTYNVKTIEDNKIVDKNISKTYSYNQTDYNNIQICFVDDFRIGADIKVFDEYLTTYVTDIETIASKVLEDNVLDMLVDYKISELEKKYSIYFSNEVEYVLSSGTLDEQRYVDYSINIIPKLAYDIDLEFSCDISNLKLEKGKEMEIEIYINSVKCDDYEISLQYKGDKVTAYKNYKDNIVFIARNSGKSDVELSIDLGFTKFVYLLNVDII